MSPDRPTILLSEKAMVESARAASALHCIPKGRMHFEEFVQMSSVSTVPDVFLKAFLNVVGQVSHPVLSSSWDIWDIETTNSAGISGQLYEQNFGTKTEAIYALSYGIVMSGIKFLKHTMQQRWTDQEVEQSMRSPIFANFDILSGVASEEQIERQNRDSTDPTLKILDDFKLSLYKVCGAIVSAEEVVTQSRSIPRKLYYLLRQVFSERDREVTLERLTLARQSVETYFTDPSKTSRMMLLAIPRGI